MQKSSITECAAVNLDLTLFPSNLQFSIYNQPGVATLPLRTVAAAESVLILSGLVISSFRKRISMLGKRALRRPLNLQFVTKLETVCNPKMTMMEMD